MIMYIAYPDLEFENVTENNKVNTWMREKVKLIYPLFASKSTQKVA